MSNQEGENHAAAVKPDLTDAVPCVPVPEWVVHDPWPSEDEQSLGRCSDNGLLRVLYDCQVSLLQPGVAWHARVVQRILNRTGAERAAHVAIEFNPAHDRLQVHFIRVWRGDQCIELARPADFQILRRETQLERLALDGRLTATLLVPDLRVDDRLETSFTIFSQHPVLSGRYSSWIVFDGYAPYIEARQRLVRPAERTVHLKAFNNPSTALVKESNGVEESRWTNRAHERLTTEELTPPWSLRSPCYQATEFEHWSEIAQLFEKYYKDVTLPPELVTELDRLAAQYSNESERAVEWLRLVQRQLRYFALALGDGGLVPRSLTEIWAKRFGDCKDAARLYVAGARYLGLDASAALVSTTSGPNLVNMLPSPQVFNHVAVRLRLQESTHWVDPTMQVQGGPLDQIALVYSGWALPLTQDSTQLESLPPLPVRQHIRCEDVIRFGPKADSAAVLERRIDFEFLMANAVRNRIEGEGLSKVATQIVQDLQRSWLDAVEKSPVQVQDDFAANRLSLSVTFEIPNVWKSPDRSGRVGFNISDPFLINELAPLKDVRRHSDIYLGRPRKTTWRARLQMPRLWNGTGWRDELDDAGIRFRSECTIGPEEVVFERDVEIGSWSTPSDKAEAYAKIAEKMRLNVATLWARADMEGNIGPMTGTPVPQEQPKTRWPLFLLVGPALVGLRLLTTTTPDTNNGNYVVDRSSYTTANYPSPPHETPMASLAPVAVDDPLESCLDTGRDSKGSYLRSSCKTAAKVRIINPSEVAPYEVTIAPGAKSYVYFMQLDKTNGSLAACPAKDQIIDKVSETPWASQGSPYRCQHLLRRP